MAFRFSFFPRDEQFFDLFNQMADEIRAAAGCSRRCSRPIRRTRRKVDLIKDAEHRCDTLTHDTIQRLHRTFVTPFDREDLYALATSLDNVMDAIDHAAALVRLYQITRDPAGRARAGAHGVAARPTGCTPRSTRWRRRSPCSRTPSRSTGSRTKPTARTRRPIAAALRHRDRSDRDHQVEGAARRARADHGLPARTSPTSSKASSSSTDSRAWTLAFSTHRRHHRRRAGLRLHQRLPRRRQFDRDGRLDARAVAAAGRGVGGVLQFRRGVLSSAPASPRPSAPGMVDLSVVTYAVILAGLIGAITWNLITWYFGLPTSSSHALFGGYARRGGRQGRLRRHHRLRLDQDADLHRRRAADRADGRADRDDGDLLDLPRLDADARRSLVPPAAAGVGRGLQPDARRQRRAEDDGHHHRRAGHRRLPRRRSRCRSGSSCCRYTRDRPRHAERRLAHHQDDGHEDHEAAAGGRVRRGDRRGGRDLHGDALGVGISTTHTITGAIVGVGATRRLSAVRWGVAGQIVWAWILTIPASATIGATVLLRDRST